MSGRDAAHAMIERSPFFRAAGEGAMKDMLVPSFVQSLPKGTVLFEQGKECEFLHLLLTGSVGLHAKGGGRRATVVEILRDGEVFLAPAVVLRLSCPVSAVALTAIRVLMIPAAHFRRQLHARPEIGRASYELLCRHWNVMVDQVVDLKLNDVETRVSRFIAHRISEEAAHGRAILPEPRTAIAARLGMTPETLSRAITSLEEKGALRRGGGSGWRCPAPRPPTA